jgi:uncharacterized protein with HEPN domain
MSLRDPAKYLADIQEQCLWIQQNVKGQSLKDFLGDGLLRPALERKLEIVGEALNQMLKLEPSLELKITDAKKIIAFRNRLIHGYSDLDPEIVWGAATEKVPGLLAEIEELLKERRD